MDKNHEIKKEEQPVENNREQQDTNTREQQQRSSAFNEQSTKDRKSTHNVEEEAGLEQEAADQLRALITGGKLGAGVFSTPDCQATYEELSAKGVVFLSPPAKRPYGVEAIFKDTSGNWFSLTQHEGD